MKKEWKWIAVSILIAVVSGCSPSRETGGGGGGGGGDTKNYPQSITLTVSPTEVSLHGGTANISATVVGVNGGPVDVGTAVEFSVDPSSAGTISPAQATTNQNGVATATFTSGDVPGTATITARAGDKTQPATITVLPPQLSSIVFISAEPTVIQIQGSGGTTSSKVTFEVRDTAAQPVEGIQVSFELYGPEGGEYLDPLTSSTNSDGRAITYLNSGRISGPARIVACTTDSITGKLICTSSTPISIGGGKPSHMHLSLARKLKNISGLLWFGINDEITAFVADRFGNIIESPITVSFFTEGGGIETAQVIAEMGKATTILQTQEPIPRDVKPKPLSEDYYYLDYPGVFYINTCETQYDKGTRYFQNHNPRDGLVTIIATTKGEETFFDANGNGVYDSGEDFIDIGEPFIDSNDNEIWDDDEPYTDSDGNGRFTPPEPFDDANENCAYDSGEPFTDLNGNNAYNFGDPFTDVNVNGKWDPHEFYFDANTNGKYDGPNGRWDEDISIWQETKVVFSGMPFYLLYLHMDYQLCDTDCSTNCVPSSYSGHLTYQILDVPDNKCAIVDYLITGVLSDVNGNPPPMILRYKVGDATVYEDWECYLGPDCVFLLIASGSSRFSDPYPGGSTEVSTTMLRPKLEVEVRVGYDKNFSEDITFIKETDPVPWLTVTNH